MNEFVQTDQNRVTRRANRGHYDKDTIYAIADEALICHVGFIHDGRPFVIPTIHARDGDRLILHGSKASRLLSHVEAGEELSVAITIVDGIVFARSIFDHSMNYRSAILYGRGRPFASQEEKLRAAEIVSEHIARGRWHDARTPNEKELGATTFIDMEIESASAKVRTGPPMDDDPTDYELPVWAGVLPMPIVPQAPLGDPRLPPGIVAPDYITHYRRPGR